MFHEGRVDVKKLLVISASIAGLALTLLVDAQAQGRVSSIPSGGTPLLPDALVNGPVPRMPDGKPDLTGPWLGGGSNQDIEREGGLKPGELPLLPWLRARDVSLLVGDAVSDVQPSGVEGSGRPVHTISMVAIGLPLVDNGYLEHVAREALRLQRWEFMISWQINQSLGGTAVPFNGVATF